MVGLLFFLIIAFVSIDFIFERVLALLNVRDSKKPVPALLSGIYSEEEYQKQQSYFRTNTRFGMISSVFSFLLILLLLLLGGFGWLDALLRQYISNPIFLSLAFFGILYVANDLISIPFDCYDTFVIEQRFGFNKVTPKLFVFDHLKGLFLAFLLGGIILSLIMWFYQRVPDYFWLLAWACLTLFSLFISFFYSTLIVPLFNKQTPLPGGELRDAIESFAQKVGFQLNNIYVIDGSKRSTKANAYFTGFGRKKRIVLYDTLISSMSNDEIVAVLAHEIGHYKHKHVIKNLLINIPYSLAILYLLGFILNSDAFAQAMGGVHASFHLNLLAFGLIYSFFSVLLGTFVNALSRRFEYQADHFAKEYGMAGALVSALKVLSSKSLTNLTPHPFVVFITYSHPTLYQRIAALMTDTNKK